VSSTHRSAEDLVVGDPFQSADHDHDACVADALAAAEALCERRNLRLTPLRRRVLELVWASHHPIGAYDILDRLGQERGRVAPPTVYRTLAFLAEHGLVHRIDTLNAFVGCARPGASHRAYFLICRRCRSAAEFEDERVADALGRFVARAGFHLEAETVELSGLCRRCRRA
jgi:Fur family transcriptional regulator, zinc uptake regulator